MKLNEIAAQNARGMTIQTPIQPVTVITGPNGSGKSTHLELIEAVLNPPGTGRGIPVFGSASKAEWWAALSFEEPDLVIERRARGRGEARVEGHEWGPFKEIDPLIHEAVGPAAVFHLDSLLAQSSAKRRTALMEIALSSGAGLDRDVVAYLRSSDRLLPAKLERAGYTPDPEVSPLQALADLVERLAADLKDAKRDVQQIEKAIKSDEAKLSELSSTPQRDPRDVQRDLNGAIERQTTLREEGAASAEALRRLATARELLQSKIHERDNADTAKAEAAERAVKLREASLTAANLNVQLEVAIEALNAAQEAHNKARDHEQQSLHALNDARAALVTRAPELDVIEGLLEIIDTVTARASVVDRMVVVTRAREMLRAAPTVQEIKESERRVYEARAAHVACVKTTQEAAKRSNEARMVVQDLRLREAAAQRTASELGAPRKALDLDPKIHDKIDELRIEIAELESVGAGVDQEELDKATVERKKLEAELVKAQDVAAQTATLAERRAERRSLVERRTTLHELHKAVDAAQAEALEEVLSAVLQPIQRIVYATTGDEVDLVGGSDLVLQRLTGTPASIPLDDASDSERRIVLGAFRVALATLMPGWRHVAIDCLEALCAHDQDRRTAFVAAMVAEVKRGTLDNVLFACVQDDWTAPEGVHVVDLEAR